MNGTLNKSNDYVLEELLRITVTVVNVTLKSWLAADWVWQV